MKKLFAIFIVLTALGWWFFTPNVEAEPQAATNYRYDADTSSYRCGPDVGPDTTSGIVELRLRTYSTRPEIEVRIQKCDGTNLSLPGTYDIRVNGVTKWSGNYSAGESRIDHTIDPRSDGIYGTNDYEVYLYSNDQPDIPKNTGVIQAWGIVASGSRFVDVAPGDNFADEINAMYDNNITRGETACRPPGDPLPYFCPTVTVDRAHMAVFMVRRALNASSTYTPPGPYQGIFIDVGSDHPLRLWMEKLYDLGLTEGCSGSTPGVDLKYCPNDPVSRGQAAIFLAKTENWPLPNQTVGVFVDIVGNNFWEKAVESMWWQGYTNGDTQCTGTELRYCPSIVLSRAHAAGMMSRAFGYVTTNERCATLTTSMNPAGSGSVSTNPASPDCPINANKFRFDTNISLTPQPATSYAFEQWTGAVTGNANPGIVKVGDATKGVNKSVTANFVTIPVDCYSLTVTRNPFEGGSVTADPGPNCTGGTYTQGTAVTLTATPSNSYIFDAWSGDISSSQNPTTVTMDGNKTMQAGFMLESPAVSVFSGSPSSKLFIDNNGDRLNLEVCADNLSGQTVHAQLSRPNQTFDVVTQQATQRCVVFWDIDGVGKLLENTPYTTRAALNQNPDSSWSVPCFSATGGEGLCDTVVYQNSIGRAGYKLPYPGGISHKLGRNRHGSTPAYDFGLPLDEQVVASRAGTVISTEENSSSYACNASYSNKANFVGVRHDDGSVAWYYHLRKNGVSVNVGQDVQRGQLLGYTGLSGYMCGAHLHFEVNSGGVRRIVHFEDTGNSEPAAYTWYTSGNYLESRMKINTQQQQLNDLLPEGQVQFRLNQSSGANEIKLMAYDYLDDVIDMRVASSEDSLQGVPWVPYTNTLSWAGSSVFVQYRTADNRISKVYSDTIPTTANDVIKADFDLDSSEICVGEDISLFNNTVPYCPQCSWEWDLGNGLKTQAFNPTSDVYGAWWEYDFMESYFDPNLSYSTPGTYTITASVENANHTSTVSKQVSVINSISADFSVAHLENTVIVTATEANATSWEWEFGDGITATGRTASYTYSDLSQPRMISLKVHSPNGCVGESYQIVVQRYHTYLPLLLK